jgi:hypothetical protein
MMEKELATYLASNSFGTLGLNLFYGDLPESAASDSMWVIKGVSPKPRIELDAGDQFIDVWVRGRTSDDAQALLQGVISAIHRKEHWDLPSYHIYFSRLNGEIQDMDRDVNRRKLYMASFAFLYRVI